MNDPVDVETRADRRTIVIVWAALCAVTLLNWSLTPAHATATTRATGWLVAGIVLLGLVKTRLIIQVFMEVRYAPVWLRRVTDAWLVVLWTALLTIFLTTR